MKFGKLREICTANECVKGKCGWHKDEEKEKDCEETPHRNE